MKPVMERLGMVLGQDSSVACAPEELNTHMGNSAEYLIQLGLEPQDLKRLERMGLAIRGRLPTRAGHVIRWVILQPKKVTA